MRKIAFVINPNAGGDRKRNRLELIRKLIPVGLDYELFLWEKQEDKEELFRNVMNSSCDVVAAVGGDGTVNHVAAAVKGSGKTMAIIPFGSGNGLARHLGIPLQTDRALGLLSSGRTQVIDSCYLNDKPFFCTAGIGFDAHIGKLFAESKTRGMTGYAWMTLKEFSSYKASKYTLTIDGQQIEQDAFLITFANAAQYGGQAYIAPHADIQDGLIDLTIIRPFPLLAGAGLVYKLFSKGLKNSGYVQMLRGKHILIERNEPGPVQFDGETAEMGIKLELRAVPGSLKVIVP
jgi:diacylglycerol kinase (ATP)